MDEVANDLRSTAPLLLLLLLLSLLSSKMDWHSRSVSNPSLSRYPFDYDRFFVMSANEQLYYPSRHIVLSLSVIEVMKLSVQSASSKQRN